MKNVSHVHAFVYFCTPILVNPGVSHSDIYINILRAYICIFLYSHIKCLGVLNSQGRRYEEQTAYIRTVSHVTHN